MSTIEIAHDIRERIERLKNGEIPTDFNWNSKPLTSPELTPILQTHPTAEQAVYTQLVDESLRDGLGGIERFPKGDAMLKYVDKANDLGIDVMTVGIYPGKESRIVKNTIKDTLTGMRDQYPHITPVVLSLATQDSLGWLADMKEINPNLEGLIFMGTSPIRMLIQNWTPEYVINQLAQATQWATDRNIPVIGATEHTTQTPPDYLKDIIKAQVDNGAHVFCIADTIGRARPEGVWKQVQFVRNTLDELGAKNVKIDYHGHEDLGLSTINSLTAIAAGADRVHVVTGGLGERAGNTSTEGVLVNLNAIIDEHNELNIDKQLKLPWNLEVLSELMDTYLSITGSDRRKHGPLGSNAFVTQYGLHADALWKAAELEEAAIALGEEDVARRIHKMFQTVYTAIDPRDVGRQHEVVIGPLSGDNTVYLFALQHGLNPKKLTEKAIKNALNFARESGEVLSVNQAVRILSNGKS